MTPTGCDAPVREVLVFEDRAFVRREASLRLEPGRHCVALEGIAPVLVDKSCVAEITAGDARVDEVRVRRQRLLRDRDRSEALRSLLTARDDTERQIAEHHQWVQRIEQEIADLEVAARLLAHEVGEDVAWGRADVEAWETAFEELHRRERELRVEAATLRSGLLADERRLEDLAARVENARSPSDEQRCRVEVDLDVRGSASVVLRVGYLVPNACWRPHHRATLRDGRVVFETDACVWQRTGEDWKGARLRVSTERSGAGAEPPRLSSDRLRARRRDDQVGVQAREQVVQTLGLGRLTEAASEVPGVDDGGQPRSFEAEALADIPSDGRPYRVRLHAFEAEARVERRMLAELVPALLIRSEQTNESGVPILAGPVDLVRESGRVGRTRVLFVAAGERFELGWGPDPDVRVHRTSKRLEEQSRVLSTWVRIPHRVELRISNLAGESKRLEVAERVPVSEVEQVKVEVEDEAEDGVRARSGPDADGILRWSVDLAPHGRETLRLEYTLLKKPDVVGV